MKEGFVNLAVGDEHELTEAESPVDPISVAIDANHKSI
jgi:hypothetical protein